MNRKGLFSALAKGRQDPFKTFKCKLMLKCPIFWIKYCFYWFTVAGEPQREEEKRSLQENPRG